MQNFKVLLTGVNGFLGKYINKSLVGAGYEVVSVGQSNANIICNLAGEIPLLSDNFFAVVHAAGKAHMVPKTDAEEKAFFEVNLEGTRNLLTALDGSGQLPKFFVFISTVSVYGKNEGENINETYPLAAQDPYGLSKVRAEELVKDWSNKNNVVYYNLRLPLISGENPKGNLGSMIKAITKGYYFRIGKGQARKSIVQASDVGDFIPTLFTQNNPGEYNLTDGAHPTFAYIENKIAQSIGKKIYIIIPGFIAYSLALIGNFIPKFPLTTKAYKKITSTLTFSDEKARKTLGWKPQVF